MTDLDGFWALLGEDTERLPLVTMTEARAAVTLLQRFGEEDSEDGDLARHLAAELGRRLPAVDG